MQHNSEGLGEQTHRGQIVFVGDDRESMVAAPQSRGKLTIACLSQQAGTLSLHLRDWRAFVHHATRTRQREALRLGL